MENDDDGRGFVRSSTASQEYHVLYDWSGDASLVSTIVRAVSEVTGREPGECVYDRIDPDGLDALFRRAPGMATRDQGAVTFPFAGFEVTVHADGMIHLRELERGRRHHRP